MLFKKFWIVPIALAATSLSSCGDGDDDENNIQQGIGATVDFNDAYGVLVLDNESGTGLRLMERHNQTAMSLKGAPVFELEGSTVQLTESTGASIHPGEFHFPGSKSFGLQDSEESSGMKKIKSDGSIEEAIEYTVEAGQGMQLPEISTIAVAPTGEVYLHFRYPFIYRDAPMEANPWDMENGYQCQIFKVTGGVLADLQTSSPDLANLECVDNQHFIDEWRTGSNDVFQFDQTGAIYYPGSIPNSSKMVVYKVPREGGTPQEIINAQICVQDFLITDLGGVFYTGNTCQDGNNHGGGGGFFRYVSPNGGGVIEIARDWWDFIFDTKVTESADGSTTDEAVFFGPDPRNASSASWDSACLFNFDPSQSDPLTRVQNVITCGGDIWSWLWMERSVDETDYGRGLRYGNPEADDLVKLDSWKQEFRRRCQSDDEVFAGGGSQISSIEQDSTGDIFVIGDIRKKVAGNLTCGLEIRGPHCKIDGIPVLYSTNDLSGGNYALAETSCTSNAGTWVDDGYCTTNTILDAKSCADDAGNPTWYPHSVWYGDVTGDICTATENGNRSTWWSSNDSWTDDTDLAATFIVQHYGCEQEGGGNSGDWTNEYKALAKVDSAKQTLSLLSTENEQAIDVWIVNDQVFYSSFDASVGQYLLNQLKATPECVVGTINQESSCTSYTWQNRRCVDTSLTTEATCLAVAGNYWSPYTSETVLSNFEAYNLAPSAASTAELWTDGLDFSNNEYRFGTVNLETKELSLNTGLTGTLKTIVILSE